MVVSEQQTVCPDSTANVVLIAVQQRALVKTAHRIPQPRAQPVITLPPVLLVGVVAPVAKAADSLAPVILVHGVALVQPVAALAVAVIRAPAVPAVTVVTASLRVQELEAVAAAVLAV